jgi:hypothetical protein
VIRLSGIGVFDFPEIQGCKVGLTQWFDREESAKVAVTAPRGERSSLCCRDPKTKGMLILPAGVVSSSRGAMMATIAIFMIGVKEIGIILSIERMTVLEGLFVRLLVGSPERQLP